MKQYVKFSLLAMICFVAMACQKSVEYKQIATKLSDFPLIQKKLGSADFEITPPKSNSDAPIKYKSSDKRIAIITGTTVKIIGLGSTTITAYQEATDKYTADSIRTSLITAYENPTITDFTLPEKTVGDAPFKPTQPKSNSKGAFQYISSDGKVATIIDGQTITITGPGEVEITAFQQYDGGIYSSGAVTAKLVVKDAPVLGRGLDNDGVNFQTIKIGDQTWMAENLRSRHYRNGEEIQKVTDETQWKNLKTAAYCSYNNDDIVARYYGQLYNWYAVNDARGISPKGWHVATDAEWDKLYKFAGNIREGGMQIKEKGTEHWDNELGATNSTLFTALGAGYRESAAYPFGFTLLKADTKWWSATTSSTGNAWYYSLYVKGYFERHDASYVDGYSIRCVKD